METCKTRKLSKIALLSASANLQQGSEKRARQLLIQAKNGGCTRTEIARVLIAGAHINLGRASYLTSRKDDRYRKHFRSAAVAAFGEEHISPTQRVIEAEQLAQLGIPAIWREPDRSKMVRTKDVDSLLLELAKLLPDEPAFHVVTAERLQRRGENSNAIRAWQKAAELLGQKTPQIYYDRLTEAYKSQGSFPAGKVADEQVQGQIDKYEVLHQLHRVLRPKLYLEIGVQAGKSLALAKCEAVGVDPMPMLSVELADTSRVIKITSDDFFAARADSILMRPPDLVFIDGMHLFEYALRDFMNVERYSHPATVVVLDDVYPNSQAQAARERATKAWAGDIWKVFDILAHERPDLVLVPIDAYPTGVLLIGGLDSSSLKLQKCYKLLVDRYKAVETVPEDYLLRTSAWRGSLDDAINILIRKRLERK